MKEYVAPKKLLKSRCPICREKGLYAIGVDPDHPVIKNNIVARCEICGSISNLNRTTFVEGDITGEQPTIKNW